GLVRGLVPARPRRDHRRPAHRVPPRPLVPRSQRRHLDARRPRVEAVKRGELIQLRPRVAPDDLSDEALVAACITGDPAARGPPVERHVDAVHGFLGRMRGSDAAEVDDLAQATFLAAFRGAARFRGGSVRAWLYGIAANLTRNYARREIRRKRLLEA